MIYYIRNITHIIVHALIYFVFIYLACHVINQQSFLQSPSELKAKYKSLMSKFHPDRHHALASAASPSSNNNEEEVRSQMATMATDVTRAYSVLEDPLSRSLHLLELGGEAISESDRVSSSFFYILSFLCSSSIRFQYLMQ